MPALEPGTRYKYRVNQADGGSVEKADPFAFQAEVPPNTASIVSDLNDFQWQDQAWLDRRAASDYLQEPISIYEVHLGSCVKMSNGFMAGRTIVTWPMNWWSTANKWASRIWN